MIDQSTATRARLIEGTVACLRRRGLAGTTSREITGEAGVNLAAITYHFGSKDKLVAEALLDAIRRWLEPVLMALRSHVEPLEKLTATVSAGVSSFGRLAELLPVYLEGLVQATRMPSLATGLASLRGEVHELLEEQITALVADGFLQSWVEPAAMAAALMALADGLAVQASLAPSLDVEPIAGQVSRLLFSARRGR